MSDQNENVFNDFANGMISRRALLRAIGIATVAAPVATALGQGRCLHKIGSPACNTSGITPIFASTGWKTISLEHITIQVVDVQKEAAFYNALVGWNMRSGDDAQAIMDIGKWGTVVLKHMDMPPVPENAGAGGRAGGAGGTVRAPSHALVESFCFGIAPWNAKTVEAELKKRGMTPIADNDGKGFESFHVKDPDGFALQISNGAQAKVRATASTTKIEAPAPFESTGWKTVWLDHLSFNVSNYKESASYYMNLLGWTSTYDEGSQNELHIGEIGNAIVRGGNPLDPDFGKGGRGGGAGAAPMSGTAPVRRARIDHISFGITPFDADDIKLQLEKRGLRARVDTSTGDEIHVAAYKSYHTTTPNGFDLQLSYVNHYTRDTLPTAVTPKPPA
jgi:catechol 2,3-dioxygenase-like lactoylglutathione lyase family enzyme